VPTVARVAAPIGGRRGPRAPDGRVFPDLEDARLRTAITRAFKATGTLSVTVLPALESPPQSHWEAEE
jgi:hypothetical protein